MLVVDRASVHFGELAAVNQVSLQIPCGQVLAVLGPSGSGKSTLLRAIAGLEPISTGQIINRDRDLKGVPPHQRGFALMFQDGQLFPHLDVEGNVEYPLRLRRVPAGRRRARVVELLELVGLPDYHARRVTTLSGGEQQRVALARALAAEPSVLLLDEPLSALDRSLRDRLAVDLREVLTGTGTTALLVTHDQDEAVTIADRIAVMFQGRVEQEGHATHVWRHPATARVASFLGYRTHLEGSAADRVASAAGVEAVGGRLAARRAAFRVDPYGTLAARVHSWAATTDALRVTMDIDGVGVVEGLADPEVIDRATQRRGGGRAGVLREGQSVQVRVDAAQVAVGYTP